MFVHVYSVCTCNVGLCVYIHAMQVCVYLCVYYVHVCVQCVICACVQTVCICVVGLHIHLNLCMFIIAYMSLDSSKCYMLCNDGEGGGLMVLLEDHHRPTLHYVHDA